jgi:phenylalanyl-tRNA synthetase beta chain
MRVSLRWLREYVDVDVPPEVLVERLDLSGTKVEALHRRGERLRGVVVGEVVAIEEHPDADNLTLVDVRTRGAGSAGPQDRRGAGSAGPQDRRGAGSAGPQDRRGAGSAGPQDADAGEERVVCGARNFSVGDRVAYATVGARLGEQEITARVIRGQKSAGMLCSGAELGVSEEHSGILVLPPEAPLGEEVAHVLGLDDTIIELELTPNRPDCMSMIGIAREVAALLGRDLHMPVDDLVGSSEVGGRVSVEVEDERGCPRYLALEMDSVVVGPSPQWLAQRLLNAGLRPISNVVDATNYVMLETGQPLHAFDAANIKERTLVVRRARPGERLETLDGVERHLSTEDLLIADPARALAFAGVMGGADSEISDRTSEVILESAYFNPAAVAFTSRRHLLRTEASARFERGTDPNGVLFAARRAAKLIAQLAGARVAERVVDAYPAPIEPRPLRLRPARADAVLGAHIAPEEQVSNLRALGLGARADGEEISVSVPTWRPDLTREIDLVEEVGRLAGYARLPSTVPFGSKGGLSAQQAADRALRRTLAGLGVTEAWTTSFGSPADLDALGLPPTHPARNLVELANPTSRQYPAMRTTLLPGLLGAAAHNLRQRVDGVAFFEVARVYVPVGEKLPDERSLLGMVFAGQRAPQTWSSAARTWDFFAAKGIVEAVGVALGAPESSFEPIVEMPWHPTRAASVLLGETVVGALGEVHPDVCDRFDVAPGTVACELALAAFYESLPGRARAESPPRYPGVYVDVALVVDDDTPARLVGDLVTSVGAPELTAARLFDVYRGDQVPPGRKSLAFALEMRSPERTLTDAEAHAVRDRIVDEARRRVGAELRG